MLAAFVRAIQIRENAASLVTLLFLTSGEASERHRRLGSKVWWEMKSSVVVQRCSIGSRNRIDLPRSI